MKDKSYTLLELRKLYEEYLAETDKMLKNISETADRYPFMPRKFLIWLRKREAYFPDF
ncbi:MAG TPA: hypothetical protein VMW42_01415 [Desulfatiglandales bacterium]|nr:hypothetical protein [Desulfatiglandales bacterium]